MHDRSVVVFDVPRPWPKVRRRKAVGRLFYWPAIVTVWHEEPGGRDAGSLCGYPQRGRKLPLWLFRHRHHLRMQWRTLRRDLREAQEALHAMGVSALGLELRGFDSNKAWRIPYNAERAVEKSDA